MGAGRVALQGSHRLIVFLGQRSFVDRCFWVVVGCWLLVAGGWLSVDGHWGLVVVVQSVVGWLLFYLFRPTSQESVVTELGRVYCCGMAAVRIRSPSEGSIL